MACNNCGAIVACSCPPAPCPVTPCTTAVTYFPSSAAANNTVSFVPISLVGDTGIATIGVNENLTIKGTGLIKTIVTEAGNTNTATISLTSSTAVAQQKLVSSTTQAPTWVDDIGGVGGGGGVTCVQAEQVLGLSTVSPTNLCPTITLTHPCTGTAAQVLQLPPALSNITVVNTACGDNINFTKCDGTAIASINIGNKAALVSPTVIPGAIIGTVQPIIRNSSGNITLAQTNVVGGVASFLAIIDSTTNVRVLANGIHFIAGHGITPLNTFVSVSRTVLGGYDDPTTYVASGITQNVAYAFSANCLFVDVQEAQLPAAAVAVVNPCNTLTITAHGFGTLPTNGVLPIGYNGATWVKAIANGTGPLGQLIVTQIIDANTVVWANPGAVSATAHGLTIGVDYSLSQTVAGAIVLASSITSGLKLKVLTPTSTNCLSVC